MKQLSWKKLPCGLKQKNINSPCTYAAPHSHVLFEINLWNGKQPPSAECNKNNNPSSFHAQYILLTFKFPSLPAGDGQEDRNVSTFYSFRSNCNKRWEIFQNQASFIDKIFKSGKFECAKNVLILTGILRIWNLVLLNRWRLNHLKEDWNSNAIKTVKIKRSPAHHFLHQHTPKNIKHRSQ
jgi:hypothetical protein